MKQIAVEELLNALLKVKLYHHSSTKWGIPVMVMSNMLDVLGVSQDEQAVELPSHTMYQR
jgi:hypothetical protein